MRERKGGVRERSCRNHVITLANYPFVHFALTRLCSQGVLLLLRPQPRTLPSSRSVGAYLFPSLFFRFLFFSPSSPSPCPIGHLTVFVLSPLPPPTFCSGPTLSALYYHRPQAAVDVMKFGIREHSRPYYWRHVSGTPHRDIVMRRWRTKQREEEGAD